eukprot:3691385-Rhodomonas_salina.1
MGRVSSLSEGVVGFRVQGFESLVCLGAGVWGLATRGSGEGVREGALRTCLSAPEYSWKVPYSLRRKCVMKPCEAARDARQSARARGLDGI